MPLKYILRGNALSIYIPKYFITHFMAYILCIPKKTIASDNTTHSLKVVIAGRDSLAEKINAFQNVFHTARVPQILIHGNSLASTVKLIQSIKIDPDIEIVIAGFITVDLYISFIVLLSFSLPFAQNSSRSRFKYRNSYGGEFYLQNGAIPPKVNTRLCRSEGSFRFAPHCRFAVGHPLIMHYKKTNACV